MFDWQQKSKRGVGRIAGASSVAGGSVISGQSGLVNGTRVASNLGWRAVEALCIGDKVLTFDNGMRTLTDIRREVFRTSDLAMSAVHMPVFFPQGALFNRKDLWLLPGQGLLIETDAASDALGDPFAVVPAASLDGFHGICRKLPSDGLHMTVLSFAGDEVVYVEGGMLAHCPRPRYILADDPIPQDALYDVLGDSEATDMVDCLIQRGNTRAFRCDPEEIAGVA